MSKRFGRKQKRKPREKINNLKRGIGLSALLRNVCIGIRNERRHSLASDIRNTMNQREPQRIEIAIPLRYGEFRMSIMEQLGIVDDERSLVENLIKIALDKAFPKAPVVTFTDPSGPGFV